LEGNKTVHTSRTMMFSELSKVMDHAIQDDSYLDTLHRNVSNKKTKTNQDKTTAYLKQLYSFDLEYLPFKLFKYFWQISSEKDKGLISLLYAIGNDFLLAESCTVIASTKIGEKVTIEKLITNIVECHADRYSENTCRSIAQNIASSWKQAGFIEGKVKNIRTEPNITYLVVAFSFLMGYCEGQRGDFILTSKWVKSLNLGDAKLRVLAVEAARRDLLQYQFAGNVTAISFKKLFKKLEIDGI
jgi:hypothetical protein